jgi:hypothetical protein
LHLYFIYIQNREKLFIEKDELFWEMRLLLFDVFRIGKSKSYTIISQ